MDRMSKAGAEAEGEDGTTASAARKDPRLVPNQPQAQIDVGGRLPTDGERFVPSLGLANIAVAITIAVAAGLGSIALLVVASLWYAGFPTLAKDEAITTQTLFDLLKLAFAVVAGIGGVVGLVVAYRRQRVAEHTNRLAEFAHQLASAAEERAEWKKAIDDAAEERAKLEALRNSIRLFNDRFGRASDQLGSDKAAVRLAGLYSMTGLADDWLEGRQTCVDVLCAYMRMPYAPPAKDPDRNTERREQLREAEEEREVRRTLLVLIANRLRFPKEAPNSWQGLDLDFTGAVIDGGDFSGANFSSGAVSFRRAKFVGGLREFTRAKFSGANVSFSGAEFRSGHIGFFEAKFTEKWVHFDRIKLDGALLNFAGASVASKAGLAFWHSTLSSGELRFAACSVYESSHISFSEASLDGAMVSFEHAALKGGHLSFTKAKLNGGSVRFKEASLEGLTISFDQAEFNGGTASFDGIKSTGTKPKIWGLGESPPGLVLP